MPGLQLGAKVGFNGNYSPLRPASAQPSTAPTNISQIAYGINGSGSPQDSTTAYGSIAVGFVALAAMVYLWWSLPR